MFIKLCSNHCFAYVTPPVDCELPEVCISFVSSANTVPDSGLALLVPERLSDG